MAYWILPVARSGLGEIGFAYGHHRVATAAMDAVARVADGGSAIDPSIVSALISKQRKRDPWDRLTPREREVLAVMAEGQSSQGIADRFVITLRAVEKYVSSVSSIFSKLDLPTTASDSKRVLAVLLYLRG
jgi:DNA-binding NarL/FixJ family response regulator